LHRRVGVPGIVVIALAVGGCGATSSSSSVTTSQPNAKATSNAIRKPRSKSPATANVPARLGAPTSAFVRQFGRGPGCPADTCYGGPVTNAEGTMDQFTGVSTDYGVVTGFTEEFPSGTSATEARALLGPLLPSDSRTTYLRIQHDSQGNSCLFWDIEAPAVARFIASGDRRSGKKSNPKIAALMKGLPRGTFGIELSTQDPNSGAIAYDSQSVAAANVSLSTDGPGSNC
jgi:hypothetical protein